MRRGAALLLLALSACLGARASGVKSYYVLHGGPGEPRESPLFSGLLRVRTMNADEVYEKFQLVVRQSPYQLRYSDTNVWAVKPDQMLSDIIARTLEQTRTFSTVTRQLGDTRPEYTLDGDLHALEIYDSGDLWFAHLSLSLVLTRFADGQRMYSYSYDQRKAVRSTDFGHAVRTLSELLQDALRTAIRELAEKQGAGPAAPESPPAKEETPAAAPAEEPIYVPERPQP